MIAQQINLFDIGAGLHVRPIQYQDTVPFIMGIHYARRMPCIQYAFGLFDGVQIAKQRIDESMAQIRMDI